MTRSLGMMVPDTMRTILALSDDGEIAVAVRDLVDRSMVLVRDVRTDECLEGYRAALPWPWILIGTTPTLPEGLLPLLRRHPVLIGWYRAPLPEGLPAHAVSLPTFRSVMSFVESRLAAEVAGMKLAIGLGVELPDGQLARSAELQALVSHFPDSFDVPPTAFRSAQRILTGHGIDADVVRDPVSGQTSVAVRTGVGV